jgi:hypothetical protein
VSFILEFARERLNSSLRSRFVEDDESTFGLLAKMIESCKVMIEAGAQLFKREFRDILSRYRFFTNHRAEESHIPRMSIPNAGFQYVNLRLNPITESMLLPALGSKAHGGAVEFNLIGIQRRKSTEYMIYLLLNPMAGSFEKRNARQNEVGLI